MTPPRFISFDGIDGVGKSTQIERLAEYLRDQGTDVLVVRDPGTTEIGSKLREILLDGSMSMHRRTEAMLFMASRCEMIETVLRPALAAGKTVISDRFLLANVVYQSTNDTQGVPQVAPEILWKMGHLACGGLHPDLTLLLDLPVDQAYGRLGQKVDRMEARGRDYLDRVRHAFLQQLPATGGRSVVVSAAGSVEEVAERVTQAVFAGQTSSQS
ncbi:dTMP kinase [Allorhodopirellula heiligendammensis]|uniref:Thymidylate kinase n=1 Tax=Allorhodopirellula heiligendammensis TaxID=2714739 RepID=A0A5C6C6I7_9BACT|nr:dTMP kinase [Allorhodopirellula heiligendammensis]TWU19076.1 Thymidylate kinase [Allorhodopirellula heiligendammensis]